jgi:hypothetical protein
LLVERNFDVTKMHGTKIKIVCLIQKYPVVRKRLR